MTTESAVPAIALSVPTDLSLDLAPSSLGELVPMSRFSPPELAQVATLAKGVDFTDADSITSQMNAPRQAFADALTRQLAGVAVYETGAAAGIILDLSRQIKAANLGKMRKEARGEDWVAERFGKLPLIGPMVSAVRHFQLTHKTLVGELNRIRDQAQKELARLRGVHRQLEDQEQATEVMLRQMMVHIAACQQATLAARAQFERDRVAALAGDRDPFVLQKLRDFADNIAMMETRLINAQISFIDNMMAIPDIRARQQAARIEISNTIDSIQNDLPDLASAIGRLIAAYNIAQSQKGNELRRQNREALAEANADALNTVYLGAKRSQSGASEQIDQLSARLDKLLDTLHQGSEIDTANVASRAASVARLTELRDRLLDGVATHADRALRGA